MSQVCVWSATGCLYVVHWLSRSVIPCLALGCLAVVDWMFLAGIDISTGYNQGDVSTYPSAVEEDVGASWATVSSFLCP